MGRTKKSVTKFYGPILIKDFDLVKAVVRAHEGRKLKAYNPGDNNPTIGTGFNLNRSDAADVLKACGIPHKLSDLKTCKSTLKASQAMRLEDYILHEAAFIAASRLGGDKFTHLNAAQQAAAISLATNSPNFMKTVAKFIVENKWDDNFLQNKAKAAEIRDQKKDPKLKYGGLYSRYEEIQECLKKGDFPSKFYKKYKIAPPDIEDIEQRYTVPSTSLPPKSTTATLPPAGPTVNFDLGFTPHVDTSPSLLTAQQLNYFTETRNRAFAMASAVNGPLGDTLKKQALKIGLDTNGNPVSNLMSMLHVGIDELKNPKSKIFVNDFKIFAEQSYHLLSGLADDTANIAHCIGLGSGTLGFDHKKLDDLAEPFLRTAAYYRTTADSLLDIHSVLNEKNIGDTKQPISVFNHRTHMTFTSLANKVDLAEKRLLSAEESLNAIASAFDDGEETAKTWAQIFNGAATATMENSLTNFSSQESTSSLNAGRSSLAVGNNQTMLHTVNTLQYSVQFFGTVMQAIGKPDIATPVMAIAVPALNIASILCTWGAISAASGPLAPYVAIAGAIVTLGMGIASLFKGPQGPTQDEIIMRQFERLSIQLDVRFNRLEEFIETLAEHMDARFDEIKQLLIKSHELILEVISQMHHDMNKGFSALMTRIAEIQVTLEDLAKRHNALFAESYTKDFNKLLLSSGKLTVEQLGQGLDPKNEVARRSYLDNYHDFYSVIIDEAASETLAGVNTLTKGNETQELVAILKRAYSPLDGLGYESSINPIAAYVKSADDKILVKTLVNPLVWSKATLGLVNFVTNNPGFLYGHAVVQEGAKKLQRTELHTVINKGKSVSKFLYACQTSSILWEKLIADYTTALRNFVVELYTMQWPDTPEAQAFAEDASTTLEHIAGLKMLATIFDDYINGRAGPAPGENLFHRTVNLPEGISTRYPNPGHEFLPMFLVHCLRASTVRFHNGGHMRTVGREILRPYWGVAVADETNGACEEALKRVHGHLEDEVNDKRKDQNSGNVFHYQFMHNIKNNIDAHQRNWAAVMHELRNIPAHLRTSPGNSYAENYKLKLLKNSAAKLSRGARSSTALPNRELMKQAYAAHQNSVLPTLTNNDDLMRKLEALDGQAYLLKFFISLLFPNRPELLANFKNMLWDKARVSAYTNNAEPLAIVLHNLLEREHPRLPTYLENFKAEILSLVKVAALQQNVETQVQYIEPNVIHALQVLKQFESLYFEVSDTLHATFTKSHSDYDVQISADEVLGDYKVIKVAGDGHCFFRAIVAQLKLLGLTPRTYTQLRQEAVEYLKKHPDFQIGFGPDEELGEFEDYCDRMSKHAWAVGPIIEATAQMLNIHLVILDYLNEPAEPHIIHINEGAKKKTMGLMRTGSEKLEHYDAVILEEVTAEKQATAKSNAKKATSASTSNPATPNTKFFANNRKSNNNHTNISSDASKTNIKQPSL